MKRLVLVFSAALLIVACKEADKKAGETTTPTTAAPAATQPGTTEAAADTSNFTTIEWIDNINQTLPKVKEGEIVEVTYRFRNTGTKPLVVANVSASCGCTVPTKPEEPVLPGKEGLIKAKFDSHNMQGTVMKTLTVLANTNSDKILNFSLEVVKK